MSSPEKLPNCIILHGCPPNADSVLPREKKWMNWLEDQLQELGYDAVASDLSGSDHRSVVAEIKI